MRHSFIAGLTVFGLLLCTGCADRSHPDNRTQSLPPSDAQQEVLSIKDTDGTLLFTASMYRPDGTALASGKAGKSIRAYYQQVYDAEEKWWLGELVEFAREARRQAGQIDAAFRPYTVDESFEIMRNDSDYLSILRTRQSYTGGVHENQSIACETFRKSDGSMVALRDLFLPDTDYMQVLTAWVSEEITRRQGSQAVAYYDDAVMLAGQEFHAEDFFLTDSSLVMFYPAYVLAPYASGAQYFEIPLSTLQEILI